MLRLDALDGVLWLTSLPLGARLAKVAVQGWGVWLAVDGALQRVMVSSGCAVLSGAWQV